MARFQWLIAVILMSMIFATQASENFQIIDTQAQFDPTIDAYKFSDAIEAIIEHMDDNGVKKTLIVPPPFSEDVRNKYDFESVLPAIKNHRDRFDFLAGGGTLSPMILSIAPDEVTEDVKQKFRQRCEEILAAGALGFGEVTAMHLSLKAGMGDQHRYSAAQPDHPLFLLLADIAAENDVPIDIHFDVIPQTIPIPAKLKSSRNPEVLEENLQAFERFLAHNRKARINWAHVGSDPAGQRTPALMRKLLERHPNLYSAFRLVRKGKMPVVPLNPKGKLKPVWRELINDFSDRFTVHSDNFYIPGGPPERGPQESLELAQQMLEQLPTDVAQALAYGNAERIYNMKPGNEVTAKTDD